MESFLIPPIIVSNYRDTSTVVGGTGSSIRPWTGGHAAAASADHFISRLLLGSGRIPCLRPMFRRCRRGYQSGVIGHHYISNPHSVTEHLHGAASNAFSPCRRSSHPVCRNVKIMHTMYRVNISKSKLCLVIQEEVDACDPSPPRATV